MPATYDSIATTTLGSANTILTISNIPSTYTDLRLVYTGLSVSATINVNLRFNGDTGTNYSLVSLQGDGANPSSGRSANVSWIFTAYTGYRNSQPTFHIVDIFNYAGSTNKTCLITGFQDYNGSGSADARVGLWRSTAAINSISINAQSDQLAAGFTASLYGILRA